MAQILDDNTVVPSFQGLRPRGHAEDTGNFTNLALRMGEVKDIVYPDDPKSISKTFIEYSVEVQHRDSHRPGTTSMYLGCLVANTFGGAADMVRYTLRKDDQSQTGPDGVGVGSKVLLLCVNGQTTRAMIVGGLRDTKISQDQDSRDDGHNFYFEFNGLSFSVNKDGEAKIQFRGATKADGSLDTDAGASEEHGPTAIEFLKNGNLLISTKDGDQQMLVDHANKKAAFRFGAWESTVGSTITMKSAGLRIGSATDATMLGTTYRNAESQLNQKVVEKLSLILVQLGLAAAACSGPMVTPIIGPIIAGPILSQSILETITNLTEVIAGIQAFEAQGPSYLSTVNKSD